MYILIYLYTDGMPLFLQHHNTIVQHRAQENQSKTELAFENQMGLDLIIDGILSTIGYINAKQR